MQLRLSSAATIAGLIAVVGAALTGCGAGRGDSADIEPITRTTSVSTIVDPNATPSTSSAPQVIAVSPASVPASSASASSVPASPSSASTAIASATSTAPAPASSPSAPAPVVGSATMNRLSETEALLAALDAQLQSATDDPASESK
ncbi:MAG: hypothetical protein AB7N61_10470 [Acidimicrobiia bacterium]